MAKDRHVDEDPYDLDRFVAAQRSDYDQALAEIRAGRKRSHWIWYIFPQFTGLGFSSMSERYAIRSLVEAQLYLDHPVLGPRLVDCAAAALGIEGKSATEIFGSPDDRKLHSSATLFAQVSSQDSVFAQLLTRYFRGEPDPRTIELIQAAGPTP